MSSIALQMVFPSDYLLHAFSKYNVHDHFPMLIGFCLHVLEGHIGNIRCLWLVGNRLISGGDRKRIIVWNVEVSHERCFLYMYIIGYTQ